jgi:microcystin-dependent protein
MLKNKACRKSVRSINAVLCASALTMGIGFSQPVQAADPFLAEIVMFGGNFNPRGWLLCDGQLMQISQNPALFSLLGTTYGGDGRVTFGIPDMRGRSPVHAGSGPGLTTIRLGQKGGAETHTLTTTQLPSHNHGVKLNGTDTRGNTATPVGNVLASKPRTNIYQDNTPNVTMGAMHSSSITENNVGGNQAFGIRSPYLAVNFIIATVGTFPSRN